MIYNDLIDVISSDVLSELTFQHYIVYITKRQMTMHIEQNMSAANVHLG